jgi:hypothetical protein
MGVHARLLGLAHYFSPDVRTNCANYRQNALTHNDPTTRREVSLQKWQNLLDMNNEFCNNTKHGISFTYAMGASLG